MTVLLRGPSLELNAPSRFAQQSVCCLPKYSHRRQSLCKVTTGASSSKKTPLALGPCLQSSYRPCSYLDRSLQSRPDLTSPTQSPDTQETIHSGDRTYHRLEEWRPKPSESKHQALIWTRPMVLTALGQTSCPYLNLSTPVFTSVESSPELWKCHGGLYAPRYS